MTRQENPRILACISVEMAPPEADVPLCLIRMWTTGARQILQGGMLQVTSKP